MNNRMKRFAVSMVTGLLAISLIGCSSGSAPAAKPAGASKESAKKDDYPTKSINLIVPFTPGSAADVFARTLAKVTEKELGQSLVVQNKPGGSGAVAIAYVNSQPADGYTLFTHSDTLVSLFASGQVPFQPKDLTFVSRINGESSSLMLKAGDSRFSTMKEFLAYAKANPGKLKIGGPGSGSFHHMVATTIKKSQGLDFTWIPFEGGKDAALALLGGNVDAVVATPSNAQGQIDAGQIKVVGVSLGERSENRKEVPTFKENGVDMDAVLWRGVFGRAGIPAERVARLEAAFEKAMKDPEWTKYMNDFKQESAYMKSAAFRAAVEKQLPETKAFMEEIGAIKK